MKHIVIMGPGRCGTSIISLLFGAMGFDTSGAVEIFREMPEEIQDPDFQWPHVIKGTGTLCHGLKRWEKRFTYDIGHVFLCVRALEANTASMVKFKEGRKYRLMDKEEKQEVIRQEIPHTYGMALLNIIELELPYTTIQFPRSAYEPSYTYNKLTEAVPDLSWNKFINAWDEVVNEDKICYGG